MLKKNKISTAEIVLSYNNYSYEDVLNDFPSSREITIVTFNISKNNTQLLEALKQLDEDVIVTFITNLPQRHDTYFKSKQRKSPADRALENIKDYFNQLDPINFKCDISVYFCFNNHAKIFMTDNIAYIGSGNFSDESMNNLETGIIISNKEEIQELKENIVQEIINHSIRYTTSFYNVYMEYVTDWLKECNDFFKHLDLGIYTHIEVSYTHEEKVLDFYNASVSFEKLTHFVEMIYEAEELILDMILKQFSDSIADIKSNRIKKLLFYIKTQVNRLNDHLEELAIYDSRESQIQYAQQIEQYYSGDPDDLNYAFEIGQEKALADLEAITERFIGLDGYFERIQTRIPTLLQLLISELESISDILKKANIYENQKLINNTNKSL